MGFNAFIHSANNERSQNARQCSRGWKYVNEQRQICYHVGRTFELDEKDTNIMPDGKRNGKK